VQEVQFLLLSPLDMSVVEQSRHDVNEALLEHSSGGNMQHMPKEFIHTLVMQPPRTGARTHI
jgi:hypothetical protein